MKFIETARRLIEAMHDRGIKAQELADRSGVNKGSISLYVNGNNKPGNMNAGKMADVLGVDPMWLMGFDVPKLPDPEDYDYENKDIKKIVKELKKMSPKKVEAVLALVRCMNEYDFFSDK